MNAAPLSKVEVARALLRARRAAPAPKRSARGFKLPTKAPTALDLAKLSDRLVGAARELGWVEIRAGEVALTATGAEALAQDWRTPEERAAQEAAVALDERAFQRELADVVRFIAKLPKGE